MFLTLGPAGLPRPARRGRARGHGARADHRLRRAPDRRLAWRRCRSASTPREQLLLGWAGLRGAVPVVLAIFPVIEGVPHSLEFFNIVFFAVVLSTILQGTTMESLAERLGLTTDEPALPRPLVEAGTDPAARRRGARVPDRARATRSPAAPVRDLGLPRDAVVNVIVRGDEAIPPRGSTRLRAGDHVHVLLRAESAGRGARPVRPLAHRADRTAAAPAAAAQRAPPDLLVVALVRRSATATRPAPGACRGETDDRPASASAATSPAGCSRSRTAATR